MTVIVSLNSKRSYQGTAYTVSEVDAGFVSKLDPPRTVSSATYLILKTDGTVFFNTDSNAIVATLPIGVSGHELRLVNIGSSGNNVTVSVNGEVETLYDSDALILKYSVTDGWH